MSSEESIGTTSSRLRQFGLYRNIDDRTEEFLKLSRRRQIRQGCACAAVSTAITVTVVVSVLIVFEYGFHSDPEVTLQPKHKPNWFSMLNDSEVNFDINQQHTNIKSTLILPLLLKALKHNRILEKVIEEYSSNNPNYEEDATEYPLVRNVFTDARNWMRMSPSRMYAIEYKTSPIVFFRSRNIDEFYRARKMMDSRRVTNYLDRMMNDKAYVTKRGTNSVETYNTVEKISSTLTPRRATTQFVRKEKPKKLTTKKDTTPATKQLVYNECDCPSNVKDILQKLILGVQQLFLEKNKNKIEALNDCVSTTSAPTEPTNRLVTTRKSITTKKPPKVRTTYSIFSNKLKTLPKVSSGAKLSKMIVETITSTTEKTSLASVTTNKPLPNPNDANDNVIETTTFKSYLQIPYYELFTKTITTTKPMIPETPKESTPRVTTAAHFMNKGQDHLFNPQQYTDYDVNDATTTVNPIRSTAFHEAWWHDETKANKKKTLTNFLFKYKESQKNNKKFEDSRLEMFGDHLLDSDKMRTFNPRNVLANGKLDVRVKNDHTTERNNRNASGVLKATSKIAATKDQFETVIRDLTAWNTVPVNITYGSIRLPNDSNEMPISVMPQLSPPFKQNRRNEERQDDNDYYGNTNRDIFE